MYAAFLTKPLASLEKEEEGKKKFWTIKLQGATTTIQQGEVGVTVHSLGTVLSGRIADWFSGYH